MAKKATTLEYSDILAVLKAKLEAAMEEVESIRSYENAYSYSGEEVEHLSRSGFIPFTSGGYEVRWFEYVPHMMGSGHTLPTKPLQTEMERQDENSYKYAKESFIEKYPEIVEELGEDKINYSDLSEAGYESEAEELDEMHRSNLEDASIMMRIFAYYYNPENYHGKPGKHTISLQADVNLESPYHRSGNLDDGKEVEFTFTSISDLEKKIDANIKKLIAWFGGSDYKKSKTEMKIRRMENGGEIKKFNRSRGKKAKRSKKRDTAPSPYEIGKFYDDKGTYQGVGKRGHRFRRHDADTRFKEYGARYHYEKIMASGGVVSEDMPRIYVADLAAYNEGSLVGEWLDLEDYSDGDEVMKAINALLKKWSKKAKTTREEYAIHDSENIPSQLYHESMGKKDFDKIYEIMNAAKESDIPMEVIMEWASEGRDVNEIGDAFRGAFKDMEDFAYDYIENVGGLEGVSNPEYYVYVSDTDRRIMAGEQADADVENMDDDDILERANMKSDYDEAVDEDKDDEAEAILDKAKEELHDEIYNEWYDGLNDPYDFLVEQHGLYSGADLLKSNVVQFDYEKFGRDLEQDYTTVEHDGQIYVFDAHYAKGGKMAKGGKTKSAEYFEVSLYYKDEPDEPIEGYIIKNGDVGDDDDDVFFYVDSEEQLKKLMKKDNDEDFVITSYEKTMQKGGDTSKGNNMENYKFRLDAWSMSVHEDSYEDGQGDRVNEMYEKVGKTFDTPEALLKYCSDNIMYDKYMKSDFTSFDDGRIISAKTVDVDNHVASASQIEKWKSGNLKLYTADYSFYVLLVDEKTPTMDELAKVFGIESYKDGGAIRKPSDCSCNSGGFSHNETLQNIFGA